MELTFPISFKDWRKLTLAERDKLVTQLAFGELQVEDFKNIAPKELHGYGDLCDKQAIWMLEKYHADQRMKSCNTHRYDESN